ncbi:MAG: hypothetical protein N3D10_02510 [Candidatus Micrarchaeota archaeon]|nr:hypothetical protein [Candidatus Micrarchaeota archaeon]
MLLSSSLNWKRYHCKIIESNEEIWINKPATEPKPSTFNGKALAVIEEKDLLDELLELGEAAGCEIFFISSDTPEGKQFLESFYGIGAFLRYSY